MTSEDIIAAVYQRRALWDLADPHHRNVPVLKRLWKEISKELNMPENTVRRKWKNLRDYYGKELKKGIPYKSEDGASFEAGTSTWPCFPLMHFLKDIIDPDSKCTYITQEETASFPLLHEEEGSVDLNTETQFSEESHGNETEYSEAGHYDESDQPQSPSNASHNTPGTSTPYEIKPGTKIKLLQTKTENNNLKNGEIIVRDKKRKVEVLKEQTSTEDEDLHFFKSMLPYIKKLSDTKRLRLRCQMQNMLLLEIEKLEN